MRRLFFLPTVTAALSRPPHRSLLRAAQCSFVRSHTAASSSNGNADVTSNMSGFKFSTPNFSIDGAVDPHAASLVNDLVTSPVTTLNFARDVYGPWLVLTEELQGEMFVDHDHMVYFRPANGLGFGVGRIDIMDACATGIAFSLELESYTYSVTSTAAAYAPSQVEVTGFIKRVESKSGEYSTFSLIAKWRSKQKDGKSGTFNAAKLSPWDPSMSARPWEPNGDLQGLFNQVFPKPLILTSHLKRSRAAQEASGNNNNNNNNNNNTERSRPYHMNLEPYHVGDIAGIYYIPNYISEEEEQQILDIVKDTPKELKTQLQKRVVQEWGCVMCEECNKSFVSDRNTPPWIDAVSDMLLHDGIFTPTSFPNSTRVHEYQAGEGIGPHCDGPIYYPLVSILSLGSPCAMSFYARRDPYEQPMEHYNDTFRFDSGIAVEKPAQCVVLEPRSLLLFRGDAYYYHPHGTSDRLVDDLSPDGAGKVVNRHLLACPEVKQLKKGYRVSITTRNLLPRCNHQPTRAEYGMKRAWYIYNQLPVPEPLITPPPSIPAPSSSSSSSLGASAESKTATTKPGLVQGNEEHSVSASAHGNSGANISELEKKLDMLLSQQSELAREVREIRQLIAMESTFRNEVSTVLNHLSSTMLDIDSRLDNMAEEKEERRNDENLK